jgi:hypothetical protein
MDIFFNTPVTKEFLCSLLWKTLLIPVMLICVGLLVKYNCNNQVNWNEIGKECSAHGVEGECKNDIPEKPKNRAIRIKRDTISKVELNSMERIN